MQAVSPPYRCALLGTDYFVCGNTGRQILCYDIASIGSRGKGCTPTLKYSITQGSGVPIALWPVKSEVGSSSASSTSHLVRCVFSCGTLIDVNVTTGAIQQRWELPGPIHTAGPFGSHGVAIYNNTQRTFLAYNLSLRGSTTSATDADHGCVLRWNDVPSHTTTVGTASDGSPLLLSVDISGTSVGVFSKGGVLRKIPVTTSTPLVQLYPHRDTANVAAGSLDGTVFILTIGAKDCNTFSRRWHSKKLLAAAWSPFDATTLWTGGFEGVLCAWSTVTYKVSTMPHFPGRIIDMCINSTDPTQLAVTLDTTRMLIIDTSTNNVIKEVIGMSAGTSGVRFQNVQSCHFLGKSGVLLYNANTVDELRICDAVDGRTVWTIASTSGLNRVGSTELDSFTPTTTTVNAITLRSEGVDHIVCVDRTNVPTLGNKVMQTLRFFHYDVSKHDVVRNTVVHDPHTNSNRSTPAPVLAPHPTDGVVVTCGPEDIKIWCVDSDSIAPVFWVCCGVKYVGATAATFSKDGSVFACVHTSPTTTTSTNSDSIGNNSITLYDVNSMRKGGNWSALRTLSSGGPEKKSLSLRDITFTKDDEYVVSHDTRTLYVWALVHQESHTTPTKWKPNSDGGHITRVVPSNSGGNAVVYLLQEGNNTITALSATHEACTVLGSREATEEGGYITKSVDIAASHDGCVVLGDTTGACALALWKDPSTTSTPTTATDTAETADAEPTEKKTSSLKPLLQMTKKSSSTVNQKSSLEDEGRSAVENGGVAPLLAGPSHALPPMSSLLRSLLSNVK